MKFVFRPWLSVSQFPQFSSQVLFQRPIFLYNCFAKEIVTGGGGGVWGEGVTVCCFQTPEAGMSTFRKQLKNTSQGALEVTQIL